MKIVNTPARIGRLLLQVAGLAIAVGATSANAMPSFARQTGMNCSACHVGAYGPHLTPAGIKFKLSGYTDSDGKENKNPLSAMFVASYTKTKADQNPAPDHLKSNNNFVLDEASLFYAGKISNYVGAFVQLTHSGIEHTTGLDQTDIRYAREAEWDGKSVLWGVSVNNNPGVQDPFNTMPIWSFPFVSSEAGFGTGEAATLINGGLEGRVLGASAYAFVDGSYYGELGTYRSLSPKLQQNLGLGGDDTNRLGGNTYWRMAYMKDMKDQAFHAGVFGWNASLNPDRNTSGPSDHYKDVGVDASYQFLGTREHIATVNGSYVKERKLEGATGDVTHLKESRLNATYHYNQTWGGSVGLFSTRGDDPDETTKGQMLQVDWTPWGKEDAVAPDPFSLANIRLGAQYWKYNTFEGDRATAADHNTMYIFAWTSF